MEVLPFKGLKWAEVGGWRDSERWWPLLIQRAATFLNSLSSSLPSHAAPAESKKTFSAPPRDRYVSSPRPCWSGEQMGAGEGGGGTQPQRRTLLSLLNSLNIVAAKQVTGTDWRQLTCPGCNPLNSLTPLSTHNASASHPTTRSYSQVSPSPPSPQTHPRHPPPSFFQEWSVKARGIIWPSCISTGVTRLFSTERRAPWSRGGDKERKWWCSAAPASAAPGLLLIFSLLLGGGKKVNGFIPRGGNNRCLRGAGGSDTRVPIKGGFQKVNALPETVACCHGYYGLCVGVACYCFPPLMCFTLLRTLEEQT